MTLETLLGMLGTGEYIKFERDVFCRTTTISIGNDQDEISNKWVDSELPLVVDRCVNSMLQELRSGEHTK